MLSQRTDSITSTNSISNLSQLTNISNNINKPIVDVSDVLNNISPYVSRKLFQVKLTNRKLLQKLVREEYHKYATYINLIEQESIVGTYHLDYITTIAPPASYAVGRVFWNPNPSVTNQMTKLINEQSYSLQSIPGPYDMSLISSLSVLDVSLMVFQHFESYLKYQKIQEKVHGSIKIIDAQNCDLMIQYVTGFALKPTSSTYNQCKQYASISIYELDRARVLKHERRVRVTQDSVTQDLEQFSFHGQSPSSPTSDDNNTGYRSPKRGRGLKGEKLASRQHLDALLESCVNAEHNIYFSVCTMYLSFCVIF